MQRFFAQKDFFLIVSWLATLIPQAVSANPTAEFNVLDTKPTIAIIVDDLGYDLERGHRILQLPGAITISILPFTPHARELAEQAAIDSHKLRRGEIENNEFSKLVSIQNEIQTN